MAPKGTDLTEPSVSISELFGAAALAQKAGRLDDAVQAYRRILEIKPDAVKAHQGLGETLKALGRAAEAAASLQRVADLQPGDAESHYRLGNGLFALRRFEDAAASLRRAVALRPSHAEAHNNLANALAKGLRVEEAVEPYQRAIRLKPGYFEAHYNLANALMALGRYEEAAASSQRALDLKPDFPMADSNRLMCLMYRPDVTPETMLAEHRRWDARHGARPGAAPPAHGNGRDPERRLRIGYVSADLRRHPVGYFLANVLATRDRSAVEIFCYSNSAVADETTEQLKASADHWRNLAGVSDADAAEMARRDGIDILVDLSGHTAASRLGLFTRRPAPVQAAWLGYPGTTGVSSIDYLVMDAAGVPAGAERWCSEAVVRLPHGRFCYAPPDYAPPVDTAPHQGRPITFGSFNNITKIGPEVVRLWTAVLEAVPGSRLVLKWTSLVDPATRRRVADAFAAAGLAPGRLELRGPSPHAAMLAQYGDIDIALDPFPFGGGLTSCEALWMGVPVVTLPGDRPASRQTLGFLDVLGLDDLAAGSPEDHVRIAAALAADPERRAALRTTLRPRMAASPLCDGGLFTPTLESAFRGMWRRWCAGLPPEGFDVPAPVPEPPSRSPGAPLTTFLHVGCSWLRKAQTTPGFNTEAWTEIRLDIDPAVRPDIIGTMTDMSAVAPASVDAVFSSHNIEHLYPHEVPTALAEFIRVLKDDGFAVITCPDLKSVAALIAADGLDDPAYVSSAGPIAPMDILYGHRAAMEKGNLYMAHRCGFTEKVLRSALYAAGFKSVASVARPRHFALWALASKSHRPDEELIPMAKRYFGA